MSRFENDEFYGYYKSDYEPDHAPTFEDMWKCGECLDCDCDPDNCYACGQCACYDYTKRRFVK